MGLNEPTREPTTDPTSKLWVTTRDKILRRNRAGLRFEAGNYREVEIIKLSDAQIADVQKTGASVVNAAGAQAILDDEALDVRDTPPAPPSPRSARAGSPIVAAM